MCLVYVVYWIFLQTFQTYFCIQANSVDPVCKSDLKSQADDKAVTIVVIGSLMVKKPWILSKL